MEKYCAFNGNAEFRAKFIEQLEHHRMQDAIAKGSYGEVLDGRWQGCAVACSLRSLDIIDGVVLREHNPSHQNLAARLGIPLVLAKLEDQFFERIDDESAMLWPERFGNAIKCGADLSKVWLKFAVWLLTEECKSEHGTTVANLYLRELSGDKVSVDDWRKAANAASAAAYYDAAYYAANAAYYAACYAADAYYANAADAAAADAANAAVDAAYYAAAAAAAQNECYKRMADKLIELMEQCDA